VALTPGSCLRPAEGRKLRASPRRGAKVGIRELGFVHAVRPRHSLIAYRVAIEPQLSAKTSPSVVVSRDGSFSRRQRSASPPLRDGRTFAPSCVCRPRPSTARAQASTPKSATSSPVCPWLGSLLRGARFPPQSTQSGDDAGGGGCNVIQQIALRGAKRNAWLIGASPAQRYPMRHSTVETRCSTFPRSAWQRGGCVLLAVVARKSL
jgi:hypothetical protein